MSVRYEERFVPSIEETTTGVILPEGYYTWGMQEGRSIEEQSAPAWHSEEYQGNSFEYFERSFEVLWNQVETLETSENGVRVVIDTWA